MVIGVVEESSERHFFLWPPINGAHNQYTLDDTSRKDLLDCDWLHVSGISLRFSPVKAVSYTHLTLPTIRWV